MPFANSLTTWWARSTLVRIGIVLSVVAVLTLSVMVVATVFAEQSSGKASAINVAGSLRMQSYLLSTRIADATDDPAARAHAIEEAIAEFDRRLRSPALMGGLDGGDNTPVRRMWDLILAHWTSEIRPLARAAIDTPAARLDFLRRVPSFVAEVDVLVHQIETEQERRIRSLRATLVAGFAAIVGLVALALWLLSIEVFRPIGRLAQASRAVRTGNCQVRATATGPDEIGQLGQAFNYMVEDLARLYGSLERQVSDKTQDLARRNRSLALLYETTRTLGEKPLDGAGLQAVLERVSTVLGVEGGVVCSYHAGSRSGVPLARSGNAPPRCDDGECRQCAGDPGRSTGAIWQALFDAGGEHRVLAVPLVDAGMHYGVMRLAVPAGKGFEDWQIELAETIGRHVGTAIAAAERREEHRRLGVMEERAAIARELHDSLAQSLSYTKIQLMRLATLIERGADAGAVEQVLSELREGVAQSYRQLRELLGTFRLSVGGAGLAGALRDAIAEFERRSGVKATLDNDLVGLELGANEHVHVLQIVREALSNIEHHDHARHARVQLARAADARVEVTVDDDGIGIRTARSPRLHFGLSIMRDRAASVGGTLDVSAQPDGGTRVRLVFVPLSHPMAPLPPVAAPAPSTIA